MRIHSSADSTPGIAAEGLSFLPLGAHHDQSDICRGAAAARPAHSDGHGLLGIQNPADRRSARDCRAARGRCEDGRGPCEGTRPSWAVDVSLSAQPREPRHRDRGFEPHLWPYAPGRSPESGCAGLGALHHHIVWWVPCAAGPSTTSSTRSRPARRPSGKPSASRCSIIWPGTRTKPRSSARRWWASTAGSRRPLPRPMTSRPSRASSMSAARPATC